MIFPLPLASILYPWRSYNMHLHAEPKEKVFLKVLGFHVFQIPSAGLTDGFLSISLCKKAQCLGFVIHCSHRHQLPQGVLSWSAGTLLHSQGRDVSSCFGWGCLAGLCVKRAELWEMSDSGTSEWFRELSLAQERVKLTCCGENSTCYIFGSHISELFYYASLMGIEFPAEQGYFS